MADSALLQIEEAFAAILALASFDDLSKIFGETAERIYWPGDLVDYNSLPVAELEFGDNVGTELKQTTKTKVDLPVEVVVTYDATDADPHATLRSQHTDLVRRVHDIIMNNRELGDDGPALDVKWISGGAQVLPVVRGAEPSVTQVPDVFAFKIRFNIEYRHRTADSTIVV